MSVHTVHAIFRFEMARWFRTIGQSLIAPVISTSLYFIVFGSAIGNQMPAIGGVPYAWFIVPGLVLLTVLTESLSNASFGIYMPKWAGTIYELHSAPVSPLEVVLGYVGAASAKSMMIGAVILATARLFVPFEIDHPLVALLMLALTSASFCMFGFILGVLAKSFEQLQIVPMLIITPLTFLGGTFYSVDMLPDPWRQMTLFNPIVYLVSGFRWSFYSVSDVSIGVSIAAITFFLAVCFAIVYWIFRTGYRLKS